MLSGVFPPETPPTEIADTFVRAGARRAGLSAVQLAASSGGGPSLFAERGLTVTHVVHGPLLTLDRGADDAKAGDAVRRSVELTAAAGAGLLYGPTGGAIGVEWEEAATRFVAGIEPLARYAHGSSVSLLIEPTVPFFADMSILHTLRDTAELAGRAGVGVCLDIQHCWTERDLRTTIRRAAPLIELVQISDWIPGDRHHHRAVPGDGAIPLERILGWVLDTGYAGRFDLEIYPEPAVDAEDTIHRAMERATTLLLDLGV
jgi:sugar phosphate isomerase/epimerase